MPAQLQNVRVRRAFVLVVLRHGPDCREQFSCPFPRVRVRRDFGLRAEPLEDLLERRALLVLREARIDLRDGLLESVHPEDELFALGQELRVLFARHGETRLPMQVAFHKTSQMFMGRSRLVVWMSTVVGVAKTADLPRGEGRGVVVQVDPGVRCDVDGRLYWF